MNQNTSLNGMSRNRYQWQKGFGAFTYSKSHIDNVVKYVLNQPVHHKKESFKVEYLVLLEKQAQINIVGSDLSLGQKSLF